MRHLLVGGMTTAQTACGAEWDGPNATRTRDRVTCPTCLAWKGFPD